MPWEYVERVEDIQQLMLQATIEVQYVFREANQLADFTVNEAINRGGEQKYNSFLQLPSEGRKILSMDKFQVPSL